MLPEPRLEGTDLQLTQYSYTVEATVMDRAAIDVRQWTEKLLRERIAAHCTNAGLEMQGPILIDWTARAAVRTRPLNARSEDS